MKNEVLNKNTRLSKVSNLLYLRNTFSNKSKKSKFFPMHQTMMPQRFSLIPLYCCNHSLLLQMIN